MASESKGRITTLAGAVLAGRADSALIRAARAHEPSAWAALYDDHFTRLYRYAYARLHRREEAEDLAAQVFLEALHAIDAYEDRGRPILGWLYRIAHNLVVDHIRRDERARRVAATFGPGITSYPDPEESVESIDLLDALGHLTPGQREVIVLRFFLQMSVREVSATVAKSEPAVVSLQSRALAGLKRRLQPQN